MLGYKIVKNTLYSAVSEGSNFFLFLLAILAARILGDTLYGKFSFALAFVGLFQILPDFGIGYANTIEVSRDNTKAKLYFCNSLGLQIFASVLTILFIYLIINLTSTPSDTKTVVYLLGWAMIIKSFKTTFRWIFKSFEKFNLESLTLTIERVLTFGLGVWILFVKRDLILFSLMFLISRIIDIIITIAITSTSFFMPIPKIDLKLWLTFLKKGFPFVIVGAMITIFFQIDAVMLSFMRTAEEVGWYSAPYRLIEMFTAVPRIIGYALLPTISALYLVNKTKITGLYNRGIKYLLLIALPVCIFTIFKADIVIKIFFGSGYQNSIIALQILIVSIIFMFISNLGETVLAAIEHWRYVIYAALVSVTTNIILNLLLIPKFGYIGAGIATIITEFVYFYLIYCFLLKLGHRLTWGKIIPGILSASILFTVCLLLLKNINFIISGLISSFIYIVTIILLKTFDKEEIRVARAFLQKIPSLTSRKK